MSQLNFENVESYRMAYPKFRGQTLKWLNSDLESTFKSKYKNKKTRRQLHELGWLKTDIEYKINSYGFRCNEFTDDPAILWLGCSYTSGIGLPESDTFAYRVSNSLGLQNWNLGLGAASNNSCFRIGSYWIEKLKPKIVILASPDQSRFEMLDVHDNIKNKESLEFPKEWYLNEKNQEFNRQKNALALYYYCKKINAKYIWFPQHTVFPMQQEKDDQMQKDLARDLAHPGVLHHQWATEKILEKINAN